MEQIFHPSRILLIIVIGFLAIVAVSTWYAPLPTAPLTPSHPIVVRLGEFRDDFITVLARMMPKPHDGFVAGVLVGAKSSLPKSLKQDFARTGTSHIIAVSGYNISIIAIYLMAILLWIVPRPVAFWITVILLLVFMLLTGAQASVVRATLMGIAGLVARRVGRLSSSVHILLLTAGIMVALEPSILLGDIGFQLSFLATVGLLWVSPILEAWLPFTRALGVWGETALMTISAQVFVMPLIVWYFKSISIIALPVNILVLPFIPLLMLLGFLTGAIGWILPPLGQLLGMLTVMVSSLILGIIRFAAELSWASVPYTMSWFGIMAWYAGMVWLLLFLKKTPE